MNIVITGAGKGIGFDTALTLAEDTENTIIAISRSKDGLNKLKEISVKKNLHIDTYVMDLKELDEAILQTVFSSYKVIDVLINNAGILINKPFMETSVDEWKDVFETNLFGTLKLIQFLVPFLAKSQVAHVVNMGSMGGFQGSGKFAGLSAYSSSKAALANLTECLAEELKSFNIKVNCLALGSVNTEMLQAAFPSYIAPVNSNEMAKYIAHFALHSYPYFNGKILPVSVSTP